jgi:hypothetical protein
MHVTVTPVARSIPHEPIEGVEESADCQVMLETTYGLFREIMKEPTGFVNRTEDTIITFSDAGRSFTIAPKPPATEFSFYTRAKKHTVTGPMTVTLPLVNSEGQWYMYFNDSTVLHLSNTVWDLTDPISPIATGYWDSTNSRWIFEGEERHGLVMDHDTHSRLHRVDGTRPEKDTTKLMIKNTTTDGDGSLNSHAQYGITSGYLFDEDLDHNIVHSDTPAEAFEQYLSPYAKIPIYYLTGTGDWRMKDATDYPFYENSPNPAFFNRYSGGAWTLQPCTNGYFFATWLIFTNNRKAPVSSILGQRQDPDLITSVNSNQRTDLIIPKKFTEESMFYRKLIWETNTAFGNTPKVRLRYVGSISEVPQTNDRYVVLSTYNGNAGTGKYLEFFSGQGSDTAPFTVPEISYIRVLLLTTVANSTGTVSVYRSTDLVNPMKEISLSNESYKKLTVAIPLTADERIIVKVTSGALNKPNLIVYFQNSL